MTDDTLDPSEAADLRELVPLVRRAVAAFERERFWRKFSAVMMAMGLLAIGGFASWTNQEDCDSSNESRRNLPIAFGASFGTAWDRYGPPDDPDGRAALVDDVRTAVAALYPPKDCSWPA